MYILEKAKPGAYKIKVKYFLASVNRASARTKVSATVFKKWGRKYESIAHKTVSLVDNKENGRPSADLRETLYNL